MIQNPLTGGVSTPADRHVGPNVEFVGPSIPIQLNDDMDLKRFGGNGVHSDVFVQHLLERLRKIPDVSTLPTHALVPKSLGRRYSKLGSAVFDWWLKTTQGGESDGHVEASTLFLRVFDYLLTRDMRTHPGGHKLVNELPKEEEVIVAQYMRVRVQRMEVGFWLDELDLALVDPGKAQEERLKEE